MGSETCPGNGGTGPRCPEAICDCFIDTHPENPGALRPEYYTVIPPEPRNPDDPEPSTGSPF